RALAADGAAQSNHGRGAEQSDAYPGCAERRLFSSNCQVTSCYQLASGRSGYSLDFCNHRLWDGLDLGHQLAANVEDSAILVDILSRHFAQIMTGRKDFPRGG